MGIMTSNFLHDVVDVELVMTKEEYDRGILYALGYDDGFSHNSPRPSQRDFEDYKLGYADGTGDYVRISLGY